MLPKQKPLPLAPTSAPGCSLCLRASSEAGCGVQLASLSPLPDNGQLPLLGELSSPTPSMFSELFFPACVRVSLINKMTFLS